MGYALGQLASRFRRPDVSELAEQDQQGEPNLGLLPRSEVVPAPSEPQPRLMPREALAIKQAGTDYSAPTADAIKAASGMRLTPRSALPPVTGSFNADAGPQGEVTPSGLMPRESVMPPSYNAPRPPLRTVSRSYGQFEDERANLPTEQQYVEARRPHGLLPRVGSALKLAGRLAIASGLNPLVAAEGLAIGGLDKDADARFTYRHNVEPQSVARQQRYLSDASREIGIGNILNDNARAEQQMQINSELHRDQLNRQTRLDAEHSQEWQERLGEKLLNDFMTRNPGRPIPGQLAERAGHPYLAGYIPPARTSARGTPPHFEYNQRTGEIGIVERDENGVWQITRPQGTQMQPTPDRPASLGDYKATIGPEAYGVKNWNDLIDNPAYGPAYQAALEAAKSITEPGADPVQTLNTLIAAGKTHLPPRQITAYEYAKQNPHPLQGEAVKKRDADKRNTRLTPRSSTGASATGQTAGRMPVLRSANVPEAARRKGMNEAQFRQWFQSQGGVIQ